MNWTMWIKLVSLIIQSTNRSLGYGIEKLTEYKLNETF